MNTSLLSGLIFIAVFAGVVFIHEFGHFIVARLLKVEVEEFGFGLPPRMLTFWRGKGFLVLHSGKRVEIPRSFNMPFEWSRLLDRETTLTADPVNDQLLLRSIEMTEYEEKKRPAGGPIGADHILVDKNGRVIEQQAAAERVAVKKLIGNTARPGQMKFSDTVSEVHPGTAFTLNWLPIGGFVRPKGENDPGVPGGLAASSPWTRLAVLFAGPLMNLLLGVVVFSLLFYQMGVPDYSQVQIDDVLPGSPAARAGIQMNDVILTANGAQVNDPGQLHDIIYANLDQPVEFTVRRGSEVLTLTATPSSTRPKDQGALGISMGPVMVRSGSILQSLQYGTLAVYGQTRALVLLPAQMLRGQISPEEGRFIGIKGIYDIFGQAVSRDVQSREPASPSSSGSPAPQTPTFFTLQLIGVLTISLGIINLFPVPALDGGRILFVLIELLVRHRIPPQLEMRINAISMALLLAFMVYVNLMDFINPAAVNLP
jgi:regulator of sigma E protease